ncbi:glycosyltransferase family 39 protein [Patescibacteria group bacterium]|nr:glycosyltransferase family 39 protein [Patescibacteria group bacterium]
MFKFLRNSRFWLVVILLIAAGLRFYNLSGYLQFLGDQGRDVLVVKAMIVNHKWTLLGPSASVGGFFTGPIYYYFMLPFLWLFRLDPVGPAYLSALIGVAMVALTYWFAARFFDTKAAIIASFLVALSPKMIDISRFSWNPNPVPFFTLITVALLYLSATRKKIIYTFLAGVSYGILFQLHYMNLALAAVIGLAMLLIFPVRDWLRQIAAVLAGFLLGNSLFIIFEIRHGFPNTKSIWEFITRRGQTVAPRSSNLVWLIMEIQRRLYGMLFGFRETVWEYVFFFVSLIGVGYWVAKIRQTENSKIKAALILVWLLVGTLGVGSYQGQLNDHYFGYLYPLPFLLLGVTGSALLKRKVGIPVFLTGAAILSYFMIKNLYLWQPPHNMLSQIQEIDRTVLDYAGGQPYNLGLISNFNTDQAYRYYLELWNRAPVTIENPDNDPRRETVTNTLVVICEEKKCEPLGNPLWEIAGFGRAEIVDSKMGPAGISIYKLIHYTGK